MVKVVDQLYEKGFVKTTRFKQRFGLLKPQRQPRPASSLQPFVITAPYRCLDKAEYASVTKPVEVDSAPNGNSRIVVINLDGSG